MTDKKEQRELLILVCKLNKQREFVIALSFAPIYLSVV